MEPLVPLLVVPDIKASIPLTPFVPAFTVRTTNAPLVVAVPSPVATLIAPPVKGVESPPSIIISPPLLVEDVPTLTKISPPSPPVATPVEIAIDPDAPELVVPDLNANIPLLPAFPAFTDWNTITPLLVVLPYPELNEIDPPDLSCPRPAAKLT